MAKGADGAGDKGSGDITTVDMETLLEAILKDFQTLDYFPQLSKYQDLRSINNQIKGILAYTKIWVN
jgi:hypothetical protein